MDFAEGPLLKLELAKAGLGANQFAEKLHVSKATMSRWLSGGTEPPRTKQAEIAKYFPAVEVPWRRARRDAILRRVTASRLPELPEVTQPTVVPARQVRTIPASSPNDQINSGQSSDVDQDNLINLGLDGLADSIRSTAAGLPGLDVRDKITATRDLGRLQQTYEKLHREATTARQEFRDSAEFQDICKALLAAFPGDSLTFRDHLARAGVDLPLPPPVDVASQLGPPTSLEDLDALITQLRVAKEFRDGGEPSLAWAHTIGLELDLHAKEIASLLEAYPERAQVFLDLLESQDRALIRCEFNLRTAITEMKALPGTTRDAVARLVTSLRYPDVAEEILSVSLFTEKPGSM